MQQLTWCMLILCFSCVQITLAKIDDSGSVLFSPEVTFHGEKYHSEDDNSKEGWAFYGIRYGNAQRYQPSVLNTDYSYKKDLLWPKQGHVCPQIPVLFPGIPVRNLSLSEDCLYMDIYVPISANKKPENLPVMLWVHGGGYQFGDKDMYNASHLASAINVVVVTVNYRLSTFGFLSTACKAAKGNYGLGDLKVSLQWTQQNIEKFGGNSSAITIFGESAGGAAVSALFLDPQVHGSIKAAIAMSGSTLSAWGLSKQPREAVVKLAIVVGCPNGTSTEMVECLKNVSMDEILKGTKELEKEDQLQKMHYGPVVDGEHITFANLTEQIEASGTGKSTANFISGYLREDSSLLLLMMFSWMFNPNVTFGYENATVWVGNYLRPLTPCAKDVLDEVVKEYNISESDTRDVLIRKLSHFATDTMFGYPAMKEAFLYANRKSSSQVPNQFYVISYDSDYKNLGAFHIMDLIYVFGGALRKMFEIKININPEVTKSIREMLRQVAYEGRISGPNFGANGAHVDLNQSGKFEPGQRDFKLVVDFYDNIISGKSCQKLSNDKTVA